MLQDHRDDDAELIVGDDFGGLTHLQCFVIAQSGCVGGQTGQDQENPASFGNLQDAAWGVGQEHHAPGYEQYREGTDGGGKIGVDTADAHFAGMEVRVAKAEDASARSNHI